MPTIEVSHKDLCKLIGKNIGIDELRDEYLLYAKCELDHVMGDTLKIDVKDTNRPDLWSAEGVAREIRLRLKQDFPIYKIKKSGVVVKVDKQMKDIRPYTVCAVVRNIKMNHIVLSQLIQLQEKVGGTFGRNRKEVAIGVYDLDKIKTPIKFIPVRQDGIRFAPLDFDKEMTPKEILEKHQKGKEYGHLLKGMTYYPLFIDSAGHVLSMPPIINSNHTGKITDHTKNLFIECSGFNLKFLAPALNIIVAALHERGGKIESVKVDYGAKSMVTPDLSPKKYSVDSDYINNVSGIGLKHPEMVKLLKSSGYKVSGNIKLLYPAYRQDIMHPRDVVEDVIISYGMNRITPENIKLPTKGRQLKNKFNVIAEVMMGCGFQEVLSYTLTNKSDIFEKMEVGFGTVAEIENPQSSNWSVFRNWLIPGLMDVLSKNKHVEYPQRIFELGNCIDLDDKKEMKTIDRKKLAGGISNSTVSYEEISSILDALLRSIGISYSLRKISHRSFIEGRVAEIVVKGRPIGIVGEIHPRVLNNWKLEKPVTAFEIDIENI